MDTSLKDYNVYQSEMRYNMGSTNQIEVIFVAWKQAEEIAWIFSI